MHSIRYKNQAEGGMAPIMTRLWRKFLPRFTKNRAIRQVGADLSSNPFPYRSFESISLK